jgi:putative chitinase
MGNGDEASGDGWKYHGRGAIQLTGHDNYAAFAAYTTLSIDTLPAYLVTGMGAVESACWFWLTNGLNAYADRDDMVGLTKRINGGIVGLDDRASRYTRCLATLRSIAS